MLRNAIRRAKVSPSTATTNESFICLFCKKTPQLSYLRPLTTTASCLKKRGGGGGAVGTRPDLHITGNDALDELRRGIKEIVERPLREVPKKKKKKRLEGSSKKVKPVKELPKVTRVASGEKLSRKSKEKKETSVQTRRPSSSASAIKGVSLATALKRGKGNSELDMPVSKPRGLSVLDPDLETLEPIKMQNHENPPHIHHDLDRVLFNQGVHYLQDPRSRVYNFDPYLRDIMPVTEFNFEAVDSYITSSKDKKLETIAKGISKKYVGSTSSMTSVLSHFHFLLSHWRGINADHMSKSFPVEYRTFTQLSRAPVATFLRYKGDGTYAIDADKEFDTDSILSLLGRSLEKMLTLPPGEYESLRKSNKGEKKSFTQHPDTFHYSTLGDFLMRSQLDAYDPRLPGTGMFDLKTRAVVSVRMDVGNFHLGSGYQIKTLKGQWESFEREYFDMIRAAFLKYSLQVRMGRMDGIFVAFHNTERIFGFQYVSLDEMDSTIHEGWGSGIGDREFKSSLMLMNKVLDRATERFPEQSIRFHFETRETQTPQMYIIAEPVSEEQIEAIQGRNERDMNEFLESLEKKRDSVEKKVNFKGIAERFGEVEEPVVEEGSVVEIEGETGSGEGGVEQMEVETEEVYEQGQQGLSSLETEPEYVSGEGEVAEAGVVMDGGEDSEDVSDETVLEEEEEEEEDDEDKEEIEDSEEDEEELDEEEKEPEEGDEEKELEVEERELEVEDRELEVEDRGLEVEDRELDPRIELDSGKELNSGEPNPEKQPSSPSPLTEETVPFHPLNPLPEPEREILAMTLTTYNLVNGKSVLRPGHLRPQDKWTIEYSITEAKTPDRAWNTYAAIKTRRKKAVEHKLLAEDSDEVSQYVKYLRTLSRAGRTWAAEQEKQFCDEVPVVYRAGEAKKE